ncbi:MAG TPA: hypothetical protein VKR22_09440 [Acidimicrobiales bacterium]|nr:hypothetical protein [Acidimicrobiales bacterium]
MLRTLDAVPPMLSSHRETFFGSAAAAIPLLFISLILQSDLLTTLLLPAARYSVRAYRVIVNVFRGRKLIFRDYKPRGNGIDMIQSYIAIGLAYASILILLLGFFGEYFALSALYSGHASGFDASFVLLAALALTAMTIIAAIVRALSGLRLRLPKLQSEDIATPVPIRQASAWMRRLVFRRSDRT